MLPLTHAFGASAQTQGPRCVFRTIEAFIRWYHSSPHSLPQQNVSVSRQESRCSKHKTRSAVPDTPYNLHQQMLDCKGMCPHTHERCGGIFPRSAGKVSRLTSYTMIRLKVIYLDFSQDYTEVPSKGNIIRNLHTKAVNHLHRYREEPECLTHKYATLAC